MDVQRQEQLEFVWSTLEPAKETPPPREKPASDPLAEAAARGRLAATLRVRTGLGVTVITTNNTSTMMSVKYDRSRTHVRVRLHRMFLAAPAEVVDALAAWLKEPRARKAGRLLDTFIRENSHQVRRAVHSTVKTRGARHDLQVLFDETNRAYFSNSVTAAITWGRVPETRKRRSIRFGSYYPLENLIRIHPLLDQAFVPEFFVRYIVFHEMLHAYLGIEESPSGRQRIHTAAFKKHEQAYPDYVRAVAWQDNPRNLGKLLSRRPAKKANARHWLGEIGEALADVLS